MLDGAGAAGSLAVPPATHSRPDHSEIPAALPAKQLYRPADLSALAFQTTAEIEPAEGMVGQERALSAINFAARVQKQGFNLFVIGSTGARMQQAVDAVLKEAAQERPSPSDWVYVNNFTDAHKPIAIALPAGRARPFRDAMHGLIDDLKTALPAMFESEDYQTRRGVIDQTFQSKQGEGFFGAARQGHGKEHCYSSYAPWFCVGTGPGWPSRAPGPIRQLA